MSTAIQEQAVFSVTTPATLTDASHPTPQQIVAATLEEPSIREALHRGTRKAQVKKYAAVTRSRRDGVCEYTSDFVQATYLALLTTHLQEFAALSSEERPRYAERLAMRVSWREVYPMKREEPLEERLDNDQFGGGSTGHHVLDCDDISLNGQSRHANWTSAHAFESDLIERIDQQRSETLPEEHSETRYERMCRRLGARNADWLLGYEHCLYKSAKTSAERVKYHRLRKRLEM